MTLIEPAAVVNRFLSHTDWQGYLRFLEAVEGTHVRVTYDRGRLELMTTSDEHEQAKSVLRGLLEALMEELGMDYLARGSLTLRRETLDRGLEPDECYWLRDAEALAARRFEPDDHPAPELALEVEISRSVLDRLGIYEALGAGELWRARADGSVVVLVLGSEGYHAVETSPTFPDLPLTVVEDHLRMGQNEPTGRVVRSFRRWVRENLASR